MSDRPPGQDSDSDNADSETIDRPELSGVVITAKKVVTLLAQGTPLNSDGTSLPPQHPVRTTCQEILDNIEYWQHATDEA